MKSSMRSRLEHLSRRLVDLDAILSEPDAANDMNQYRKLSRERAELEPVVNAFSAFEETQKGSITPGKLADLVVLSKDILTIPEDQIPDAVVDYTIVGGKVVYNRTRL